MFAALTFEEASTKNIFKRIFRHNKPTVTYEKKEFGNDEYYLITCKTYCGKADYAEIARLSGNERCRLVTSKKVTLPDACDISAYRPDKFKRYLLRNGTLDVLKKASVSPSAIDICLYDKFGKDTDFLLCLLPFSINITVLTERPDAYIKARFVALSEYGAPVSISQNPRYIKQSDVLISLDSLPEDFLQSRVIFSNEAHGKDNILTPYECYIPDDIAKSIPSDFDKNYFYAAFCENSLSNQLELVKPISFFYRNSEISINQAANIIKKLDKVD